MKPIQGSILLLVAIAATGLARTNAPDSREQLLTLKKDLKDAADFMRPCLPIYKGHCGNAKNDVHKAEVIVNVALKGSSEPKVEVKAPTSPAKSKQTEKKETNTQKSAPPKPEVKAPTAEKPNLEDPALIAASQANLQKGSDAIHQALKDLKAAAAALPEADSASLEKLLEEASDEAEKALAIHATKPE